mgnify:CR=1 FL=1
MNNNKIGVTLKQAKRSCGINCPPKTIVLVGKPSICEAKRKPRCLKLKYKNEHFRNLITLEYKKLNLIQEQVFLLE